MKRGKSIAPVPRKKRSKVSTEKSTELVEVKGETIKTELIGMSPERQEELQAMFMAKIKEEVAEVLGPIVPSERIAREAEIFSRETRGIIQKAIEVAANEANEKLNIAATRRAHLFKGLTKKITKRVAQDMLESIKDKSTFIQNEENRLFLLDAVRTVVRELTPAEREGLADLPSPSTIAEDPLWNPTLSPGVLDFLDVWRKHGPRSCIVTGPSGCGKTHPIRQWARSKEIPVWVIQGGEGCATRREAVGGYTLAAHEGASVMKKQIGVAVSAALQGGLLLIDEYDKIDPFVMGQLNDLLDTGGVLMPWGEYILPHEKFRVAMTGNGLADDSGAYVTHQTSSELPMRCWGFHASWPDEEIEKEWLVKAGALPKDAESVASAAKAIRKLSIRPSPSLRTSLFVVNALKAFSWKDAWLSAYLYQFRKEDGKEAAGVLGSSGK